MPKLKSNSGAKKRLKVAPSGSVKHRKTNKRHLLTHKSSKRKRRLSGTVVIHDSDYGRVRPLLPYSPL
jgi:large subunit ribosomal protein L35